MATAAIDKGMPIEQVQRLLGHEKIDTTLRYAQVKQSNVKSAHKKYIGQDLCQQCCHKYESLIIREEDYYLGKKKMQVNDTEIEKTFKDVLLTFSLCIIMDA